MTTIRELTYLLYSEHTRSSHGKTCKSWNFFWKEDRTCSICPWGKYRTFSPILGMYADSEHACQSWAHRLSFTAITTKPKKNYNDHGGEKIK